MAEQVRAVELRAEILRIGSYQDGTYHVTLHLPEYAIEQLKVLLGWLKKDLHVLIENDRE